MLYSNTKNHIWNNKLAICIKNGLGLRMKQNRQRAGQMGWAAKRDRDSCTMGQKGCKAD